MFMQYFLTAASHRTEDEVRKYVSRKREAPLNRMDAIAERPWMGLPRVYGVFPLLGLVYWYRTNLRITGETDAST